MLITLANSFDPDKARRISSGLIRVNTVRHMIRVNTVRHSDGIPEIFFQKVNFEKKKNSADDKKHEKLRSRQ